MKKSFLFISFILFAAGLVFAYSQGGYKGKVNIIDISDALKLSHNSYVTVKGNIIKRLSDDKYLFKDKTGEIIVEIDDDKWQGIEAKEDDLLELSGEIEKKFNSVELDVDVVKK